MTSITKSFGFGLDSADTFEGERHRYTMSNELFYEALRAVNENRQWRRSGERAQAAASKRIVLYALLGIGAVGLLFWDWIAH